MTEASKISNLNRMVLKTSVLLINFVSELRSTSRQLKKNFQSGSLASRRLSTILQYYIVLIRFYTRSESSVFMEQMQMTDRSKLFILDRVVEMD
jgi:hypothetical protein